MKAEERKELKTNTLVSTLEHLKDGMKQGPSRRAVVVLGILALAVLLLIIWRYAAGMSKSRNSKRWEQLATATSPDDFGSLVEKDKSTIQGRAARLQVAREKLQDGLTKIYSEREPAVKNLGEAAKTFEDLAKEFRATPILVQECLYGAAQAREALGEYKEAEALYEDLTKRYGESPLAKQAEGSVKRLKDKKKELETLQAELKK